ncbi:hypothetical protein HDU79_003807 [Rhizoclosmatium sp. JEL0117]|nr:hypothetical protein HDU79_003807 [Rhizoclosmatium sp. JEL0117]
MFSARDREEATQRTIAAIIDAVGRVTPLPPSHGSAKRKATAIEESVAIDIDKKAKTDSSDPSPFGQSTANSANSVPVKAPVPVQVAQSEKVAVVATETAKPSSQPAQQPLQQQPAQLRQTVSGFDLFYADYEAHRNLAKGSKFAGFRKPNLHTIQANLPPGFTLKQVRGNHKNPCAVCKRVPMFGEYIVQEDFQMSAWQSGDKAHAECFEEYVWNRKFDDRHKDAFEKEWCKKKGVKSIFGMLIRHQ